MSRFLRAAFLLVALLALVALTPIAFAARPSIRERLHGLGGVPCPNSIFTCVTITVPLDHFNPSDPRTLDVVFAIRPATGVRKDMFVTVTGGPGTAGIQYADSYLAYNTPEIPAIFDIVFFDQRGIGLSGGMDCFQAAAKFYNADWRADTPARALALKNASSKFSAKCDAEMDHPEFLPYLSTAQAVEDLDQFRELIGDNKFWIYGESYGTQYVQTYANAHPDHLAGMIVDGTVDLTLDGITYYERAAKSFNDTLVASLAQCQADSSCKNDYGMKPLRAYDQLAALLQTQNQTFKFPLGNGTKPTRSFEFGDLETVGIGEMYGESGRMFMVRALAKYARDGDLVPLARLLYPNLGVDESTLKPSYDPSWSDAYYYGVECQDYGYFTGTPGFRADQYVAAALPVELGPVRLTSVIWGDLPCVYWRDSSQDTTRPPYWTAPGVPALVLNALSDPITPIGSARAVYEHLADGYLITQNGGPHVIWERGVPCIDDPVNEFLIHDTLPAQRETNCPGQVMTDYVPLPPADSRSFKSQLEAMQSTETEINYLPEYWDWDYATPTGVGCGENGTLYFSIDGNRVLYDLDACAFSKGFNMTGKGFYDLNADRFSLTVTVTGYQSCRIKYERVVHKTKLNGNCGSQQINSSGEIPFSLKQQQIKTRPVIKPQPLLVK